MTNSKVAVLLLLYLSCLSVNAESEKPASEPWPGSECVFVNPDGSCGKWYLAAPVQDMAEVAGSVAPEVNEQTTETAVEYADIHHRIELTPEVDEDIYYEEEDNTPCLFWDASGVCKEWQSGSCYSWMYVRAEDGTYESICTAWSRTGSCVRYDTSNGVKDCIRYAPSGECEEYHPIGKCVAWSTAGECEDVIDGECTTRSTVGECVEGEYAGSHFICFSFIAVLECDSFQPDGSCAAWKPNGECLRYGANGLCESWKLL